VAPQRKRVSNDRYHYEQGKNGDPNKGVEDGSGPQKKLC
jgi:hypothetical protein